MAEQKKSTKSRRRPEAATPEARTNQLIGLSFDLVEERLRKGTATSAETIHFLKLATAKEKLELDQLEARTKKLNAEVDSIESQKKIEVLYENAISAMRRYGGHGDEEDYDV